MSTQTRIRRSPDLWIVLALLASAFGPGCTHEPPDEAPPGALRGEVTSYVAARDDGTSEEYYTLRQGSQELAGQVQHGGHRHQRHLHAAAARAPL